MRVLQVIDSLQRSGGAEKFVLDLSIALSKIAGVKVDVLSIAPPRNNDYVEQLANNGIKHSVLSNKLKSLENISKLRRHIEKGNYDAVHVHLFPALYFAALAKSKISSPFKLVYTEHSTTNKRRNNKLLRLIDKRIYKKYDTVIGISGKVKENLDDHLGGDFVKIINNGVDIENITNFPVTNLKKTEKIPEGSTIVTMVSRITQGKDYLTTIKAMELLPENFHFVYVGDGPLMENLKEEVSKSKVASRLHILGLRNDVIGILKASDIIVLSTHHEGFSIAMLEAMACHKPFVASAVEGIKDLVSGVAKLFEYQNHKELANILIHLDTNNGFYKHVADACLEFAKKYDINNIAQLYVKAYEE